MENNSERGQERRGADLVEFTSGQEDKKTREEDTARTEGSTTREEERQKGSERNN